jgi:hypothetical protein
MTNKKFTFDIDEFKDYFMMLMIFYSTLSQNTSLNTYQPYYIVLENPCKTASITIDEEVLWVYYRKESG